MYGSIDAIKDNLPKVAPYIKKDAEATGKLDIKESTVIQYLEEFSSQIDAALSNQYKIPITGERALRVVGKVAADLASFKLAARYYTNISNEENHSIKVLRDDAKETLAGLISGSYKLPDAAMVQLDDDLAALESVGSEEYFTMEDPVSWQDKI